MMILTLLCVIVISICVGLISDGLPRPLIAGLVSGLCCLALFHVFGCLLGLM